MISLLLPLRRLAVNGHDYLDEHEEMVKKSFLVCGLTNALDGSQNKMICCSPELPDLQLLHLNESDEDPFNETSDESDSDDSD